MTKKIAVNMGIFQGVKFVTPEEYKALEELQEHQRKEFWRIFRKTIFYIIIIFLVLMGFTFIEDIGSGMTIIFLLILLLFIIFFKKITDKLGIRIKVKK